MVIGGALNLSEWKIWATGGRERGGGVGGGGVLVHIIPCLFGFFPSLRPAVLDPAVSAANGSGLVSARHWNKLNTTDKAIKALFVPFVSTG